MTAGREQPPRKLDATMFPSLPKHGTRLTQAERGRLSTAPARTHQEPAAQPRPAPKVLDQVCDMCGQASAKPKCGRCWGIVSGLASLKREHPQAFVAFVATIR